ncbi:PREDICTED: rab-3A-interacting protein-like isoform X2 [Priapulus caudatus]|uniref:Rab-3A-interacting protein-like isoform X2 n=1 Tax=Priapulus caudatus TaxID=37621 RepID=A0ABM1EKN8_PRICU|nr:PREDICTED: rab-3A-interacting protein-like isoform X2 [Priapulus caudatus]
MLEIKLKDEEVGKLSKVRDQVGLELQDLTASLFEEAHRMVREANERRVSVEKQLKEALSKIDVLDAEITALKRLVLASAPDVPKSESLPILSIRTSGITSFLRGHKRSGSHTGAIEKRRDVSPPPDPSDNATLNNFIETDPLLYEEFSKWVQNPVLESGGSDFLLRIHREDIIPCLTYRNIEMAKAVQKSVEENSLMMEVVVGNESQECECALTMICQSCTYRMKLGESCCWHYISKLARDRIAAVCDFFTYVRYVHLGLVKQDEMTMFLEILKLRKQMCLAKLGVLIKNDNSSAHLS